MQIVLLATNLFALAALFLGLSNFSGRRWRSRLLPLFLLVISRSLILVIYLSGVKQDQAGIMPVMGSLEVLSTFCLIWILVGPLTGFPAPWKKLAWLGAGLALVLSFLALWPIWPIPFQVYSLIISVFSPLFLLIDDSKTPRWLYLSPPLTLALANFLALLGLPSLSWLTTLLAYVFLINAMHRESVRTYRQTYKDRQKATEVLAQEAIYRSQEQQRLLEVSRLISSVSDLSQSVGHIARSLAQATHSEQVVIVVLDVKEVGLARLATVYNAQYAALNISSRDQIATFTLDDYPLLEEAMERQQQLVLTQTNSSDLRKLYSLWHEERTGPTLIQPLAVQGRSVGAFVLGNPISRRPFATQKADLCRKLSLQIAALVEYNRRYIELQWEAESLAATLQSHAGSTAGLTPVGTGTSGPRPVSATEPERAESDRRSDAAVVSSPVLEPHPVNGHRLKENRPSPPQAIELQAHRAISKAISDGIVVCDKSGQVQWVNKAVEHILGKSSQMLIGQPIGAIYGEIDSTETFEDLIVAFSRRNQPLPTFIETREQAIQGQLIPWRNEDQEWLGIIAVFKDVSREVKMERARNDFIAALSRELRSPLTTVKGYSELIVNGALADYRPEQVRVQQIIHSSTERMVEILDNAIQITARKRDQGWPKVEAINVVQLIDEAVREAASLAELYELQLSSEIRGELPPLMSDARHLRRILDNLLSNACRFTPPGGKVTVRAWLAEPEVYITKAGRLAQPEFMLSVADTGIGIPQTELKRIFDPFYQLKQPELKEISGMGMGLAVAKELVELHQGRIWVESMPGEGSVFQVALPLSQA